MKQLLKNLNDRVRMLATIQMAIVDHIAENDKALQIKLMSAMLAQNDFRDDFTSYLNDNDAPDELKLFMQEVNEFMLENEEE